MDFKKDLKNLNYAGMKEDDEEEGLIYLGSSKFDKLRRISLIKPIADRMNISEGEEINYYTNGDYIILKRNAKNIEKISLPLYSEDSALKFAKIMVKVNELREIGNKDAENDLRAFISALEIDENEIKDIIESMRVVIESIKKEDV